jgi:hypothetical protein
MNSLTPKKEKLKSKITIDYCFLKGSLYQNILTPRLPLWSSTDNQKIKWEFLFPRETLKAGQELF